MAMKSSATTMTSLVLEDGILLDEREEIDLSYWEFINNSDADYSDDCLSVDSLSDGIASWHSSLSSSSSSSSTRQDEIQITHDEDLDDRRSCHDDDRNDGYRPYDEELVCLVGYQYSHRDYAGNSYGEEEDDEDEDEDEEDFDGYDLDDELVPRSLSGKLGRQRMRKLGKRAFSKMNTSKRSPHLYVKPGCVHGKHGLGMKHSY